VTSAKNGQNVDNLFKGLTKNILQKIEKGEIPTDGVIIDLLRQSVLKRAIQIHKIQN
jgi:hypothetical protein